MSCNSSDLRDATHQALLRHTPRFLLFVIVLELQGLVLGSACIDVDGGVVKPVQGSPMGSRAP